MRAFTWLGLLIALALPVLAFALNWEATVEQIEGLGDQKREMEQRLAKDQEDYKAMLPLDPPAAPVNPSLLVRRLTRGVNLSGWTETRAEGEWEDITFRVSGSSRAVLELLANLADHHVQLISADLSRSPAGLEGSVTVRGVEKEP